MANDSFAVALRNLGGTHTIPKPASKSKSGSGKNDESGSSRQEATGGESSVAAEKVALGVAVEVEESGSPDLVTRGTKRKQPSGRKAPAKVPKAKAGRGKEIMEESESDTGESEDPEREDTGVVLGAGKYSAREIIKMMSGIPTDEDWVKMDDTGLVNVFREIGSLWGQVYVIWLSFSFYVGVLFTLLTLWVRVCSLGLGWPGLTPWLLMLSSRKGILLTRAGRGPEKLSQVWLWRGRRRRSWNLRWISG